jgi:hypothetical protein
VRGRTALVKLGLVATGLAAGLALGELALRAAGVSYPPFYEWEAITGHRLRPHAAGWYAEEGGAYVTINSDGWRDRERSRSKSAGSVRIAVLGDSMVEAMQVPLEQTFWSRLEGHLQACDAFGGRRLEVLSFGVSGYSTAQAALTFTHRATAYSPDVVVLTFFTENDVRDNSKTLAGEYPRPYFTLADDALMLDRSFTSHPSYRFKTHRLWRTLHDASATVRTLQAARLAANRLVEFRAMAGIRALPAEAYPDPTDDRAVFLEPVTAEWRDAWRVTERLIVALRDDVRAQGARFVLVALSDPIQVHPDAVVRREYARKLGAQDLFYPERRLQALATREGIEFVALAPALLEHAERYRVYLHGFPNLRLGMGHWNAEGHRVAAVRLATHFCGREKLREGAREGL